MCICAHIFGTHKREHDSSSPGISSLNDCLYPGPPLINDLVCLLLKFKLYEFCCIANIEKVYLMIDLDELDRDATRFL